MALQRGHLFDSFYGVASPLDVHGLAEEEEHEMRRDCRSVLSRAGWQTI